MLPRTGSCTVAGEGHNGTPMWTAAEMWADGGRSATHSVHYREPRARTVVGKRVQPFSIGSVAFPVHLQGVELVKTVGALSRQ
jgi:hypothetical protein